MIPQFRRPALASCATRACISNCRFQCPNRIAIGWSQSADNELTFFRYSNDVDHTSSFLTKAKGRPTENVNSATLTSDHAFPQM